MSKAKKPEQYAIVFSKKVEPVAQSSVDVLTEVFRVSEETISDIITAPIGGNATVLMVASHDIVATKLQQMADSFDAKRVAGLQAVQFCAYPLSQLQKI